MELLYPRTLPRAPAQQDDELGSSLLMFYREQEEFPPSCGGVTGNPTESVQWVSTQFTEDDIVRPPSFTSGATDDDPPPLPQSHDPLPRPVFAWPVPQPTLDEGSTVGLVMFYRDQEEPPPLPPTVSANLFVTAWLALPFPYDEILEQPTFEDTEAFNPIRWPPVWVAVTAQDGIDEVPPPVRRFDQEEPYTALTESVPWCAFAALDEDPGSSLLNFYREQEDATPPCSRESVPWLPLPFLDDEYNGSKGLANIPLDEYRPELPAVESVVWVAVVMADEHGGSPLVNQGADLEEPCTPPPVCSPIVEVVTWTPSPFLYDEIGSSLLNYAREQEDPATLLTAVEVVVWVATFATDDEITGKPAGIHADQEDAVYPAVPVAYGFGTATLDDEQTGSPRNFPREQEEPYLDRLQLVPWLPLLHRDDEVGAGLLGFGIDQEDSYTVQAETVPWLPVPFTYDETSAGLVNLPLDEFFPPLPPVEAVLWAATFSVDEEVTGSARRFGVEQEECYAIPRDQTQVMVWIPSPALGEEVGSSLGAFALEDDHDAAQPVEVTPWSPLLFRDEEAGNLLKGMGIDLEEPYEGRVEVITWSPLPFRDDEAGSSLARFGRDQEEPWATQVETVPWLLVWPPYLLGWQVDSGVDYSRPRLPVTNFALDFDHVRNFSLDF